MQMTGLAEIITLVDQLSPEDKRRLIEHVVHRL